VSASGLRYELPPVYVISEAHWNSLDAEMKRLEAAEVRLRAENLELRRVSDTPVLGWVILAVVSMGTGVAVGAWLGD
jgi:hypothetical protein